MKPCVSVGSVLAQAQNGVIFEQAVEHVEGFARAAGDDPRSEHAKLVRYVRINRQGALIVAKVARVEGGQQRALLNSEPLAVRRGEGS